MPSPEPDPLGDVAAAYVDYLAGGAPVPPSLDHLDDLMRSRAESVLLALDAAWKSGRLDPGPVERNRTAITLGLVPDPQRALSAAALRAARKHTGFAVSQVAQRLRDRGWPTQTHDVFQWEGQQAAADEVPPAIIRALASELAIPEGQLVTERAPLPGDIAAVTATSRFQELARRWAKVTGLRDQVRAAAALQQLMVTGTVRRGAELTPEAWLATLEALVAAREGAGEPS